MATMMATHYHAAHGAHYGYVAPPTPPMEESRCSLPSISNLLGLADHGSPTTEASPSSFHCKPCPGGNESAQPPQSLTRTRRTAPSRPNSSHNAHAASLMAARLPPTPPMSADTSFDNYHSPSSKSVAGNAYYFDMEAEAAARQMAAVPRMAMQPTAYQAQFAAPAYAVPSYYPTMQPTPPPQPNISGLFYQRPLPQAFPPLPVSMTMGTNPWQHHHYLAPSSGTFQQSQDRYICPTCGKAFSRPSSLRIHSHSHTGEKPFKCPHPGCGKAFSVRSNMKRHERGCHNFETSSTSGSSSVGA